MQDKYFLLVLSIVQFDFFLIFIRSIKRVVIDT